MSEPVVVALRGEVDVAQEEEMRRTLRDGVTSALDRGCDLVVDLSDVPFMDSTGFSGLAAAHLRLSRAGHRLRVRGAGSGVRRALEILGMGDFLVN